MIENHMVRNAEQELNRIELRDLRAAIQKAQSKEAVAGELYGHAQDALVKLAGLGEDPTELMGVIQFLDELCARYEADAEVLQKEERLWPSA